METLASTLKGLADPTRLRILNLLRENELCVCDLIEVLGLPQSTISRHLAYLKKTGWIESRRGGKWTYHRRTVHPSPLVGYGYAMLDDEFANQSVAKADNISLERRLAEKAGGTCADMCA